MADTNPSESDSPSKGTSCKRKGKGRKPGLPNYHNDKLIPIIERILPNGSEAWCLVAIAYKEESDEDTRCTKIDLKRNWLYKLCNNYKKPTGVTGDIEDRINHCIEIDRRIQRSTSSGLLGASSGEDDEDAYLNSASSSSEEASIQEDSQDPYNIMVEEEDEDEDQDPPADIPVTSITVNQGTTKPSPNEESNANKEGNSNVPPPVASGSTPCRKSPAASKNSVKSGKSGGKTKHSSNKE
jgi:hypothetical protein